MDVNEHDRLSSFTPRHILKLRNNTIDYPALHLDTYES
jgi:hypothetical protein